MCTACRNSHSLNNFVITMNLFLAPWENGSVWVCASVCQRSINILEARRAADPPNPRVSISSSSSSPAPPVFLISLYPPEQLALQTAAGVVQWAFSDQSVLTAYRCWLGANAWSPLTIYCWDFQHWVILISCGCFFHWVSVESVWLLSLLGLYSSPVFDLFN